MFFAKKTTWHLPTTFLNQYRCLRVSFPFALLTSLATFFSLPPLYFLFSSLKNRFSRQVTFEQHPLELLSAMMPLYVRYNIIRAVRESAASELAARLTAMSAAEDNAKDLEHDLKLKLNQKRQESITNELNEIITGNDSRE